MYLHFLLYPKEVMFVHMFVCGQMVQFYVSEGKNYNSHNASGALATFPVISNDVIHKLVAGDSRMVICEHFRTRFSLVYVTDGTAAKRDRVRTQRRDFKP